MPISRSRHCTPAETRSRDLPYSVPDPAPRPAGLGIDCESVHGLLPSHLLHSPGRYT
ncbi:hypothetical protein MICRO8M_80377 [Microbacterium sp. 8M]|nr:hypothetical protein MICRO8M_80377 [Microbacterium sp. 8M]